MCVSLCVCVCVSVCVVVIPSICIQPWCSSRAEVAQGIHTAFHAPTANKLNAVTRWSCMVGLERLRTAEALALMTQAMDAW
eukprot:COSAG05_NODE_2179_length_3433_cov_5.910318_3_plen_81_part_00